MGTTQNLTKLGYSVLLIILILVPLQALNLGLIAGDNKRLGSPLLVKKVSKLSPVFININSGLSKSLPTLPKLPPKPPPLKLRKANLPKLKRSLLAPPLLSPILPPLPLIPKLPFLPPILPPLIPVIPPIRPILPPMMPILPHLPLVPPLPILSPVPGFSRLSSPFKPIRIPILEKSSLKSLESKLTPVNLNGKVLAKLLDLKVKGSLTTPEFLKFRKILLKL